MEADRQALLILHQLDDLTLQHGPVVKLPSEIFTQVSRHAEQLTEAWHAPEDPCHAMRLKAHMLLLLTALNPHSLLHNLLLHTSQQNGSTPSLPEQSLSIEHQAMHPKRLHASDNIEPALRLLRDRRTLLGASWPTRKLAHACQLSSAQFYRCFKLATGQTPRRYVARLRVLHATELLLQPDLTLSEISQRCGFSTLARFHAAFKDVYHSGPGEWRRVNF